MSVKVEKSSFPPNCKADDFECFGPPAVKDGEFAGTMIADLGCFTQDGKDSNKYYAAHVCQHKKTKKWYAYFEWGRTGSANPSFMFIECSSKEEAQAEYEAQLHSKNDKRGMWVKIGSLNVLQAKPGKDCYLVRSLASRTTGLPDARKIVFNDGTKSLPSVTKTDSVKLASKPQWDAPTIQLMRDMNVATIAYAKNSVEGGVKISQAAIDLAREILIEARKRVAKVGDKEKDQINDSDLKELTYQLYGKIPKIKAVGAGNWILNSNNIAAWNLDCDAFESALYAVDMGLDKGVDPLSGFNIEMAHVDPNSEVGKFIYRWMPKASRNKHYDMSSGMKIHNLWKVRQLAHVNGWRKKIEEISKDKFKIEERALHQPKEARPDIDPAEAAFYDKVNVSMLFHGTRSVNVPGILRENLRLPNTLVGVAINGAMFGPGLYWADDWKKSAGYTSGSSRWGGGGAVAGRKAFMFISDTALGSPYVAPGSRGYTSPPKGHHCVLGAFDRSGVANNEFITYNSNQHQLRYLAEISF